MSEHDLNGRQQITRIPPMRPGDRVRIKDFGSNNLSGKTLRVKSLTASITQADQPRAVWRVHFEDGRCLEWHLIDCIVERAR